MRKLILISLLFISCTKEQLPENYKPIEIVFNGNNLTFFNELNQIRLSHNIPSLKGEKLLTDGCIQHSSYMFSLDSLNHDYFWSRYVNSKSKGFAEVICYGFINSQGQISGYESSEQHYEILINPIYTHIGIANAGLYQTINLAYYK